MTWRDSRSAFMELYNDAMNGVGGPGAIQISVIHGYGSTGEGGVLRMRFRKFLSRFEGHLEFTPGEEFDGNQGWTIVRPLVRLPDSTEMLAEDILDYCERPRTLSKVAGKFRRHGDPAVKQAIKSLERQGRLRKGHKGRYVTYQAV